ncbi:MAG: hypothetical protein GC136_10660 [Alphaproteobacteria bacterium]|nr:hypothetical protein [Alphaproteobacteria bacterium]
MADDSLYLTQAENDMKRYVWKNIPHSHLFLLLHTQNDRMDEAARSFPKMSHPSTRTAMQLVRKIPDQNKSAFLGIAVGMGKGFLGIGQRPKFMGVCAVNLDEYEEENTRLLALAYHSFHTIDLLTQVSHPANIGRFKAGILSPPRKPQVLKRLNLKADIFACLYASRFIGRNALKLWGKERAVLPLLAGPKHGPHTMPFPIALPMLESAYDDYSETLAKLSGEPLVKACISLANEMSAMITDTNLQEWIDFCVPAQDMAWQGFNAEEIISAALSSGSNPFLKSIGFLVSDMASIKPDSKIDWNNTYNAFLDKVEIETAHNQAVDRALEQLLTEGLALESSAPLRAAANYQNEELLHGHSFGWCAAALQASARAFDNALNHGLVPVQAARLEFEGTYSQFKWQTVKDLGDMAVMHKQEGHMLSMEELINITRDNESFRQFEGTLRETTEDPSYQEKALLGSELNKPIPKFAVYTPAPAMPQMGPRGPAPAMGPKAPGLGPGGSATMPAYTAPPQQDEQT